MDKDVRNNLFVTEHAVLTAAVADISDSRYDGNVLLPRYELLVEYYRKLLRTTEKIFLISDGQGQILQRHQNEMRNLLDNVNQGFLAFGPDLIVNQQYSAQCLQLFGRKIAGLSIGQLLVQDGEDDVTQIFQRAFSGSEDEQQAILSQLPRTFKINEKRVHVECKLISQPKDNAENTLIMMVMTDITDQLQAEEQIKYLSYHDKLTSLFNRAYIEMLLPDLEGSGMLPLSVIVVDMNGLKLANDVFGHLQGDRLLVAMAEVLTKSCRQTDIIARWGGDEFLLLLPRTDSMECSKVCERIRRACNAAGDIPIPLSAAMGAVTKEAGVVSLIEMFSVAENRMYNDKMAASRAVRKRMIASMAGMLHTRCFESAGHSARVEKLAIDFSAFVGLAPDREMKPFQQLATFHDIGKITIPKEILGKRGPLTASEWDIVKIHSDIGYRMAQSIDDPVLADIILALHERWDGQGYPYGLKGDQIPLLARLFFIVDVYDVITHERSYKEAMDKKTALQEITAGGGSQFDPSLVELFVKFMMEN
jgi:diguanylate cyclase (GGDEF)-like protein